MEKRGIITKVKRLSDNTVKLALNEEALQGKKFSTTQIAIIDYILKSDGCGVLQNDLEKALNLSRATTSSVLKTLEKNKIIKRSTASDARTKKITLTKDAMNYYECGKRAIEKIEEKITGDIEQRDLEIFLEVIDKMNKNLESEIKC